MDDEKILELPQNKKEELESILSKGEKLEVWVNNEHGSNYPFGVLVWGGIDILCQVGTARWPLEKNDPESEWRCQWWASPLGRRKSCSSEISREEQFLTVEGDLEKSFEYQNKIGGFLSTVDDAEFFAPFQGFRDPDSRFFTFDNWDDERSKPIYSEVLERFPFLLRGKDLVLDLGCGIGELGMVIEERFHCQVYYLDNNRNNINKVRDKYSLRRREIPESRLAHTDSSKIGDAFPHTYFSLIISIAVFEDEVLYAGLDQEKTLFAIFNRLVPGGYFIASGYMPLTINMPILEGLGFVVERCSIPKNLFTCNLPKQFYIARKPL